MDLQSEPFGEATLVQLSPFNVKDFQAVKRTNERGSYIAHNAVVVSNTLEYVVSVRKATYDAIRMCLLSDPNMKLSADGPAQDGSVHVFPYLGK